MFTRLPIVITIMGVCASVGIVSSIGPLGGSQANPPASFNEASQNTKTFQTFSKLHKKELFRDSFNGKPQEWTQDNSLVKSSRAIWLLNFAGYGKVNRTNWGTLRQTPQTSVFPTETHSSLLTAKLKPGSKKAKCISYRARMRTVEQLRTSPNTWEAAWFVWNYRNNNHFYYVVLKPNGWELGRRNPAYPGGQQFLATGTNTKTHVKQWRVLHVKTNRSNIQVKLGNRVLVSRTLKHRPPFGRVGLYSEDAVAEWSSVSAKQCRR